jgi:uncharacterized membrane protein YoaK (UPF0700 family)
MSDVQAHSAIAVPRSIPVVLSVVAGYVDSCTYLGLFGVFVAQVTGSFVFAGALFISVEPGALAKLLAIPAFFLAGVCVTVLVHPLRERPRDALARSLGFECLLLVGFATSCLAGMPFRNIDAPALVVALLFGMAAMGAQSALVRLLMRSVATTNVMTTNTTLLAINAAEILLGLFERRKVGSTRASNPNYAQAKIEFVALLPTVLGFFLGTALGAIAYINVGLPCVLLAIFPVGALALLHRRPR